MNDTGVLSEFTNWSLIEGNPVASFVIDRNHVITHWNRACEQLLGVPAARMIGTRDAWRAFYPTPRATMADLIVEESISEIIDSLYWGKSVHRSTVVQDAYEAEDFFPQLGTGGRWLFFTAAPIRNSHGEIVGAVETLQDITTQRIAEDALRRNNEQLEFRVAERTRELAEANHKLATSLSEAQSVSTMKSAFLAAVSGELKSPLNEIAGFANLIRMSPQDPANGDYAQAILCGCKQLDKLVNDLIALAEIRSGAALARTAPFSTAELIANTARAFHGRAVEQGIGFSVNLETSTPDVVEGDSARVQQMINTLLENAFEATQSGAVDVDVTGCESELLIKVHTTGQHDPKKTQANIFNSELRQGLSPLKQTIGAGFGVALAAAQAELCGGSLRLENEGSSGAQYTLRLPTKQHRS